jgi:radical SAM superfamily enzyme YgiQ (UPF0313 family)
MSDCFVVDSGAELSGNLESPHFIHLNRKPRGEAAADYVRERLAERRARRAVFLTDRPGRELARVAIETKRAFGKDLEIVLAGESLDLEPAVKALQIGMIDMIVRTSNPVEAGLQIHTAGKALPETQILWRGPGGVVTWNRKPLPARSKAKVLLVLMPAWNNDFAPSGLAHIAGALGNADYPVEVLDLNWEFWRELKDRFENCSEYGNFLLWTNRERYEAEARPHLDSVFQNLEERLRSGDYSYVGFSLFETNVQASRDAFEMVRRTLPSAKIFCGGPSAELSWPFFGQGELEQSRIDAMVVGEGEVSVIDLLAHWDAGAPGSVSGVCLRGPDGRVLQGGTRPLANINSLPIPDISQFNVYDYDHWSLPAYFSRGCVARCTFCQETAFWVRFRIASPERVLDMMKHAMRDYGITCFRFTDSLLNGSHRHLEKFVDQVIEQGLKIEFSGYCRLDGDLTGPLLKKMARAGCTQLAFGMESASQRVTELMRKEVDVRNYARIIRDAFGAGISVCCCVIVGFPGETWVDFFKTANTILRLGRFIDMLNLSVPTLTHISKSEKDMKMLGIHPESLNADEWRTSDGSNNPRLRLIRFWLLQFIWRLSKGKNLVPSWIYRPV